MVSNSNYVVSADDARAKCASVLGSPIVDEPQIPPGAPGSTEPFVAGMEPWAGTKVSWLMPFLHVAYRFPYEKAAQHFKDDCFRVDDDEMQVVSPAIEEAAKWAVWKLNLSGPVSHPLVALAVAVGGVAAAKWGVYELHKGLQNQGHPHNWQPKQNSKNPTGQDSQPDGGPTSNGGVIQSQVLSIRPKPNIPPRPQAPAASRPATQQDLQTGTGRTVVSGGASSSVASPTAENPTSSVNGFVIADE